MEKIKQKPIETVKTVIIAILTVSMLALAAVYIGGSQFAKGSAAITAKDLSAGAVAVGESAPNQVSVYEKNLLRVSYIGIRYGDMGGGAYATEQAADDLLSFSLDGLHALLSSTAKMREATADEWEQAINKSRYICLSLLSPLPYQIIYALSGEYLAALGSSNAVSPETLMLSFDEWGKTSLYMRDGDKYYLSEADFTVKPAELVAMASDSRLYDFEVTDGIPVSESSPLVQTLSLSVPETTDSDKIYELLTLFGYSATDAQPMATANTVNIVAPHGNLLISESKIVYTAASEGGIPITAYLDNSKSELDIDMQDVLLASVSLTESLCTVTSSDKLNVYLEGFYRKDDVYTAVFGALDSGIPISGDTYPHLAKITVQSGRLSSVEFLPLTAEKSGYSFSPFSSAWEYRYASKNAKITSIGLRYNVSVLPASGLGAAWYYTGERTVAE